MKIIYIALFALATNISYGDSNWIPYQPQPLPPQVYVPATPSITYYTPEMYLVRPLILTYDWVPYNSSKTIVLERQGFLCKHRTIINQPIIEWVYQPVWK